MQKLMMLFWRGVRVVTWFDHHGMRLIEGIGRGVILLSYHRYQLSGIDRRDHEKGKTVPKQLLNHRHVYLPGTKALSLR